MVICCVRALSLSNGIFSHGDEPMCVSVYKELLLWDLGLLMGGIREELYKRGDLKIHTHKIL